MKSWPPLLSPDGLAITVPDAVLAVETIVWLAVHGPTIVPRTPL